MHTFSKLINQVCLFVVFFGICATAESATAIGSGYRVIGYFPNWGMYRNPAIYPHDIDANLVTHINYAFTKVDTAGNIQLFDPWADTDYRQDWNSQKPYWGHFRELYDLKQKHPHLKTLVSVGGWTLSDTFSEMADNAQARKNFAQNAVRFCKQYDFDGVDIDWEYPGFAEHKGRPQDTVNFTLLLEELHRAAKANNPPLLVTIAAPAGPWHYKNTDVANIHQYLDWINLMTYDFHGAWGGEDVTNHHSALYVGTQGHPELNVDSAVRYYLEQGVPADKLVVGMPLYGRSFGNVKSSSTGLYSGFTGAGKGTTAEVGMRFFHDIKQNLLPTYQYHWDNQAKVPYLYNPSTQEFVTYDNEDSLRLKCQYIKEKNLGGAMVWELGLDVRPSWDCMRAIVEELN